jgi:small GTP-binding protein
MNRPDKFNKLLTELLEILPNVVGVVISDNDGLLIHSKARSEMCQENDCISVEVDGDLIASMTAIVEPVIKEIKANFAGKAFGTAVFETEKYRLLNIAVGEWIYTYVLTIMTYIDDIYPYAYLTSEKLNRILEDRPVDLNIPRFGNLVGKTLPDESSAKKKDWVFKFILIGGGGVGKTSLVNQFIHGKFAQDFRSTIGVNVLSHSYEFLGYKLKMNIYDMGAQKLFQRVRKSYYIGSNAGLIVFDLNNRQSFEEIEKWKAEMDRYLDKPIPFCLIGNKMDLKRAVSFQEGSLMAEKIGGSYIETSALNATNVEDAFALICYKIISNVLEQQAKKKESTEKEE